MRRLTLALAALLSLVTALVAGHLFGTSPAFASNGADGPCPSCYESSTPLVGTDQARGAFDISAAAEQAGAHVADGGGGSGAPDPCPGCQYAVFPACSINTPAHNQDVCSGLSVNCPPGQLRYRVLVAQAGQLGWSTQPSVCLGVGAAPPTAALDVAGLVDRFFSALPLPGPRPSFQPPGGAITNLPTLFAAGPTSMAPQSFDAAGMTITVAPRVLYWDWSFEPGASERFTVPGGGYPDKDVSHTYASVGGRGVTVAATWGGTYTVNGGPPVRVTGTVVRVASVGVPVREARSQLVSG